MIREQHLDKLKKELIELYEKPVNIDEFKLAVDKLLDYFKLLIEIDLGFDL